MNHLINGAIASANKFVREAKGDVVDHLGFLEGEQGAVVAVRAEQRFGSLGIMGGMRVMLPLPRIILILHAA